MTETAYVELHAHSYFSLLSATHSPEDLVAAAAKMGMPALALTECDALYGAIPFLKAAQQHGVKPIFGAEMTLDTGHQLTLLVENETGWANLCILITKSREKEKKGKSALPKAILKNHTAGLIALSGGSKGDIGAALLNNDLDTAQQLAEEYEAWFGRGNFWIEVQNHLHPEDKMLIKASIKLARTTGIGAVAANNPYYLHPEQHSVQDTLTSIRHNTPLANASGIHLRNKEYSLKSHAAMKELFPRHPELLANTLRIAERCNYIPEFGLQDLPVFPLPKGLTAGQYLRRLSRESLSRRYPVNPKPAIRQLDYELSVIAEAGLENYFLIVWDIVRFARENNILCQGRGSAANSLVAYLLNISPVDPLQHDLVFERFLSSERNSAPDIDLDFDAARREEVIQYIYDRYGRDRAAMACTFSTFRRKSSLRDVGRMFGLSQDKLSYLTNISDLFDTEQLRVEGLSPKIISTIGHLSEEIRHFPRHLGIHNGGMIISEVPLYQRIPIEPATMKDRTVVQWDKEALEEAGLIKIDILGLRMLSAVAQALDYIECATGARPDLDALTFDDPAIYQMISSGDTVGIFQVESRAQAQMLPRMKPRCFTDLIIAISLIRPGPILGDMVHPYLRRRLGQEEVTHYHERLKPALEETLGVILFQEQVVKVARNLAGFTAGQGELLRRALGSKNAEEAIERFRGDFIAGSLANGVPEETAVLVFEKLRAFGSYSFPKSHAAAFAVIVYKSAWLKHYYPAYYVTALLNNQPMGFWSPAIIVNDARRHGVQFLPIDVNLSAATCQTEGEAIRIGLNYVKNFGDVALEKVMKARDSVPFQDLGDFVRRTIPKRISKKLTENLIGAGAFDFLGIPQRDLIWMLHTQDFQPGQFQLTLFDEQPTFRPTARVEKLQMEFKLTGVSLHEHPMELFRPMMKKLYVRNSQAVAKARKETLVEVAGLNVVHQSPPTAKGFHFITLEDEFGFINLVIRPAIYTRFRQLIRFAPMLIVRGTVERDGDVTNILAQSFRTLQAVD